MSKNPFPVVSYKGPEYFCDRRNETAEILQAIESKRSLTLHSIRRLGKTGLIHHVLHNLPKEKYTPIYIDIYDTLNINDFINRITSKVLKALKQKDDHFINAVSRFFGKYRPKVSVDTMTGDPSIELDIVTPEEVTITLDTLMNMISEHQDQVVIAIDEFQQINEYGKTGLEALIRNYIQSVDNLCFIFSGSKKHMLLDMFGSAKHALFRTTQLMSLDKISYDEYKKYVLFHFDQGLKKISLEAAEELLNWTERHTYYSQYLAHRIYERYDDQIGLEALELIKNQILKENEPLFISYKNILSANQWKLLKAIGIENEVSEPTSKNFMLKHGLGAHSTVSLSLKYLLENELIYQEMIDYSDKPRYKVYDLFLSKWFQYRYKKS